MSLVYVNLGFWVGSLHGDNVGESWVKSGVFSDFTNLRFQEADGNSATFLSIPDPIFSAVWALALIAVGIWGVHENRRFVVYTAASITSTFLVTAGTFGAMSFYGYTTKKDLTSWGSFLFMGLIGIIIASLVNIFLQSPMMHWIITYAGVLIFVGLTAYDTQKIKEMNILGNEGTDEDTKEAIRGALTLYLDFINLFLMLLRIMGDRR